MAERTEVQRCKKVSICCAVEREENGNINGEGRKYRTRNGTKETCSNFAGPRRGGCGYAFQNAQGM